MSDRTGAAGLFQSFKFLEKIHYFGFLLVVSWIDRRRHHSQAEGVAGLIGLPKNAAKERGRKEILFLYSLAAIGDLTPSKSE
jgi:hypothetical protein